MRLLPYNIPQQQEIVNNYKELKRFAAFLAHAAWVYRKIPNAQFLTGHIFRLAEQSPYASRRLWGNAKKHRNLILGAQWPVMHNY